MLHSVCMSEPQWLPAELQRRPFTLSEAESLGVGSSRRHGSQLIRPFRGVRSTSPADAPVSRARDYLPRLKPGQAFAGVTAIRLLGLPWTRPWNSDEPVELAVTSTACPPKSKGVRGHRLAPHRLRPIMLHGLPVLDPIAAVLDVADRCAHEHLVGLCDALLTPSPRYQGLAFRPMCASVDELAERVSSWGSDARSTRVRKALEHARVGVDSLPESVTRLLFEKSGLPEVQIQLPVQTDVGELTIDGGWSALRCGFEYEGIHHQTDREQWLSDLARFEALARAGWKITRVTARDLWHQNRPALLHRTRKNLSANCWRE